MRRSARFGKYGRKNPSLSNAVCYSIERDERGADYDLRLFFDELEKSTFFALAAELRNPLPRKRLRLANEDLASREFSQGPIFRVIRLTANTLSTIEDVCMSETHQNPEDYRELLGILGRMQLSDDLVGKVDVSGVVQVTLMEVYETEWSQLPEGERVPWLRRVFANNLLDEIRKFRTQARDVNREEPLHLALEQSAIRISEWLASDQTSPSQKAVRMEDGIRLANALKCLPSAQREAIELHHLQELPLEEIGHRMQRSKGAVAALIFRGTRQLKHLLGTSEGNLP